MKAAVLLYLWTAVAQAQAGASRLGGTVTDTTGVIGGAQITLKQSGTGFSRAGITDKSGEYLFEELPPGTYSIVASHPGYSTWQADGIALAVNQSGRQDIRLVVGAVGDRITVTAQVSPVEADGASVGYRLDSSQISGIPLDSRNVVELVTLGPGAIPRQLGGFVHDAVNDIQEGSRGSVALNPPINGSRSTDNAFLLDGAYDTDRNTYAIAVYPPMDSVQEFHIQTLLAPAEFPQNGGGAIDVVTKSGTKTLHGSGFEYFDNEAADARNYFDDPTLPRPIFRQNEFGASAGGPVPLLKNTFFYGIYEGLRQKAGNSSVSLVPDAPTRSGDFSGQNLVYDPLTLNPATGTRTPFPGDIVPQNRIDPIASLYLAKYEPLPNSNNPSGNYLDATPNLTTTDAASGRIDHQFANYGLLTGHYTFNGESNIIAGSFPELPTSEQVRAQQAALGYTASSARWVSESRFSFTRLRMFDLPESAFKVNVEQELGLANPDTNPFDFGLPYFNATDYSMVTDSPTLPQVQRDNLWQASETLALSRGRHALKFGGSFIHSQFNYLQSNNVRGEYDYSGVFTSVDGSGVGTGDPFADFLLGYPQDTTRTGGSGQAYLRQNNYAGFAQDDWRVAPNLSVNLGLRYEYVSPYTEARDNLLNLNYSTLPDDPTLQRVSSAVSPDTHNFAPRAALAWRLPKLPLPGGMTVFRAGYGIYYSQEIAVETYDLVLNGLSNIHNETEGGQLPVLTTRNGFAQTASTGFPSYFGVDTHAPTAYVQQWTAGFQHELPGKLLLETAYIASKGTHLGRFRQFNTPAHVETGQDLPPRPGDLQSLRTFPDLGEIVQRQHIANSSYNSLQVKAEKGMGARLSLLASFVWSKSIDDADTIIPGLFDSVGAQDERNLRLERGLSFSNPGRRISAAYVYRLPGVRAGGGLLKDWSVSGTVTSLPGRNQACGPAKRLLKAGSGDWPFRRPPVGQTIVLRGLPRARGARNRCGALARRLKAGCSQDWLPHTAAEPQPKEPVLRTVGRRIACPTKIAAAREELRLL